MTVSVGQPHVRFGDPHVTSDDPSRLSIHACLYEALVRRDAFGRFRPGLAETWKLSPDARAWEFTLRSAVFSDGTPLQAAHVVASLERIRDEEIEGELGTGGVFKAYLAGSKFDGRGRLVVVQTVEPFADLLDLLVDVPVIRKGSDGFLGTAPYHIEELSDGAVTLRLRENRADLPRRLLYKALATAEERESGGVDIATDVGPLAARQVRAQTTVCTTFLCNLQTGYLASKAVRQALNLATDVPSLIRSAVAGAAVPIRGPWTQRHLGFDAQLPPYGVDTARARDLLEGEDVGLVTLDVPERLPDESRHLAGRLAEMWAAVGVEATMAVHTDRNAYALMVRDKQIHDAACFDSSPSSTFRLLWEKFHSGNRGPWWQGYVNPALDHLIDEARATPDVPSREALYRRAFRILHEDAPWIFLYNPSRIFSVSDRLRGWMPSPDGYAIFH